MFIILFRLSYIFFFLSFWFISNEEVFLRDFMIILKHSLPNYYKISKKLTWMSLTVLCSSTSVFEIDLKDIFLRILHHTRLVPSALNSYKVFFISKDNVHHLSPGPRFTHLGPWVRNTFLQRKYLLSEYPNLSIYIKWN